MSKKPKTSKKQLQELIEKNLSAKECAKELSVSYSQVIKLARLWGLKFISGRPARKVRWDEENLKKLKEILDQPFATLDDASKVFNLSKQRLSQVAITYLKLSGVRKRKLGNSLTGEEFRIHSLLRSHLGRSGLTYEDLKPYPTHCPMLGIELDYEVTGRVDNMPSLDRLDNTKGYTKENTIVCSWRANRIKNDGTGEEHLKIANYLLSKNL